MGTHYVQYDTVIRSSGYRKYVKSRIDVSTFNTFNNVVISELIKKLQEIQKEKGDVKVMVCDNENEVYELSEDMIEKCLGCVCIYGV